MSDDMGPSRPEVDEFRDLMTRVRAGSPAAAAELCRLYGGHIRRVVRRRLHHRLRNQYDSIDFLQDVWGSFFASPLDKYTFDRPEALIGYLSDLAYNKVADVFRRRLILKGPNISAERSLEDQNRNSQGEAQELPGRDPTPSQVAMANEHWEQMLDGQPERCRVLLEMLREGYSQSEIAERTGLHPKMIQRFIRKMAQRRDLQ